MQLQEYKPVDEKGFIRSYAGLNEVTERRIRNFEMETKAMLCRDDRSPNSSALNIGTKPIKGIEDIRQQQMRLDDELRKAKDDLEQEDIYDQIADNPSSKCHHLWVMMRSKWALFTNLFDCYNFQVLFNTETEGWDSMEVVQVRSTSAIVAWVVPIQIQPRHLRC